MSKTWEIILTSRLKAFIFISHFFDSCCQRGKAIPILTPVFEQASLACGFFFTPDIAVASYLLTLCWNLIPSHRLCSHTHPSTHRKVRDVDVESSHAKIFFFFLFIFFLQSKDLRSFCWTVDHLVDKAGSSVGQTSWPLASEDLSST